MSDSAVSAPPRAVVDERAFSLCTLAFYVALSLVKMRAYAQDGRIWAEEGAIFIAQMTGMPLLDCIFFLYYGHLQLPTNIIVTLATLVPLEQAPLVTTYVSFFVQSIPVALIVLFRDRLHLARWGALAVLVVIVGMPQAAEVWANSALLQFHFALLAALIAVMELRPPYPTWTLRILLAICGLSGIPANFVLLILLAQAVTTRQRERWVQAAILGVTAAIELALLATHSEAIGARTVTFDPRLYWLPIVSQEILSPIFGFVVGEDLAAILRKVLLNEPGPFAFALLCSLPMFAFAQAALVERARRLWILPFSALVLALLGILGSIGDKAALISAAGAGRYFFASNALLAIYVAALAGTGTVRWARTALVVLVLAALAHVPHYSGGPPWRVEYERAVVNHQTQINIWPPGWMMKNVLIP